MQIPIAKHAALLVFASLPALALADVKVHVFDVGAGHCTLTETSDEHYMVYDAGVAWQQYQPRLCAQKIHAAMPEGAEIALLILSHSDADHINSAAELLRLRAVRRVVRTGHVRATKPWCEMDYMINTKLGGAEELDAHELSQQLDQCDRTGVPIKVTYNTPTPTSKTVDFNLAHHSIDPGHDAIPLGSATHATTVSLLFGLSSSPDAWDDDFPPGSRQSRRRNAISIVAKLEYRGSSVLFTGDAVGLPEGKGLSDDALRECCIATERSLVGLHDSGTISLRSDILIAPHHGSANGSCLDFIQRVNPDRVVFPAGHKYGHPARSTAERYRLAGVHKCDMLRTDRGDDEGENEWLGPARMRGDKDPISDDDILITLTSTGATAEYADRLGSVADCPDW